uniref:Cytochrome P450 oxidase CYP749A87 n=1 Tax=Polygala tenuifolia TaxID=355332 RepID=A0A3G5ANP2_9FABA|nr:cytochrome P450 oxidase CYP749A87 [Polygala tenuifolia]
MRLQGIRGPSYRFFHGNTKEIVSKKTEAMNSSMELSHDILAKVQPHIAAWIHIYGRNFLTWKGPKAELIVTEPELIKEILTDKNKCFRKIKVEGYMKKLLGDGLVTSEGNKWTKLRKVANFSFHGESLKSMTPAMVAGVEMMLEKWKSYEGKEMDVFEEFRLLTSEVISRAAFGSNYLEGKSIFEKLMKLTILIYRNAFKYRLPGISKLFKSSDEIESEKLENEIHASLMKIIEKREVKVMSGEGESFGNDFLGLLLKAHHDTTNRISVQDIVDECKTFYFAGQETTNGMLAWTVFLLAIHTDWQEEARKEVLQLFDPQTPSPDVICRLKCMTMITNESLRLYPPVIGITRGVAKEVRLGKYVLPAGLQVRIANMVPHHDPQLWGKDVNEFRPERFSDGVAQATDNNAASFLPFGMGPRTCVGFNFAINEVKIALAMILQRYTFTLSPSYVHSPFQLLTLRPQHGLQIMLCPLNDQGMQ